MPQAQDFIKGWPHPELLEGTELRTALIKSMTKGIEMSNESLNYGALPHGAFMLGHPKFLSALAKFLSEQYGEEVSPKNLMSTGGASMGLTLALHTHCKIGDIAIVEEPTYYLAFTMMRDRGMTIQGVGMEPDGMNMDDLEKKLKENPGKIKLVYTIPVHHNPTGITMSDEKRKRLVGLAKTYDFKIIADEAYQLLNFDGVKRLPLFYHDDPADPRVLCCGTFSKLIGPGLKVGWIQAAPELIKPLQNIGFIDSGNNPVIFASGMMQQFLSSGGFHNHLM